MKNKTPVMTEKQIKSTISAKNKQKPRITLKNVLVQPLPRFWPEISKQSASELFQKLNDLFESSVGQELIKQKSLITNLSESLSALKCGDVEFLILSANIRPRFIAEQIILLANSSNENINVICVPDLEICMEKLLNTECLCATFKQNATKETKLKELFMWLKKTAEEFPIPQHIKKDFLESNQNQVKDDKMDIDTVEVEKLNEPIIDFNSLYVPKSSNQRAFIPKNAKSLKPITIDKTTKWTDFVAFNDTPKADPSDPPIERTCEKMENLLLPQVSGIKASISSKKLSKTKLKKIQKQEPIDTSTLQPSNKTFIQPLMNLNLFFPLTINKIQGNTFKEQKKLIKAKKLKCKRKLEKRKLKRKLKYLNSSQGYTK